MKGWIGLAAAMAAVWVSGCGAVDITGANCEGRTRVWNGEAWPEWDRVPTRGITLNDLEAEFARRIEYVQFAWDSTGLYADVLSYEFPTVEIVAGSQQVNVNGSIGRHASAAGGKPGLFAITGVGADASERLRLGVPGFRYHCNDGTWKPGQSQASFFVPWSAFGEIPRPCQVRIRVRDKQAILNLLRER